MRGRHFPGKGWISLLLAAALCLLSGCNKAESIRMDLSRRVTSLDPQFSTSWESQVVMLNLFEGLLLRQGNGELIPGAAESYQVSADGLTYTFQLRRDGVWNDGSLRNGIDPTPVTAKDFVFSFHRIFDPEVPSPWAGDFQAIQNSQEVLSGELPKSQLGVRAAGDYTLIITLSEPSSILLEQLAGPGALPCNEEFFLSTWARYGQGIGQILGNGPFRLSSWDQEALVLAPSSFYSGEQEVLCPSVILYTGRAGEKGTTEWDLFLKGKSDFCQATTRQAVEAEEKGFPLVLADETVWALVFRQEEGEPLANREIRRALALSVDPDSFGDRVPELFGRTDSLIPRTASLMGEGYHDLASSQPISFDPEAARAALEEGFTQLGIEALPKLTLLLPKSAELDALGGYLQKLWQQELRQTINLEVIEDEEFQKRISAGEFQLAITSLSREGGTPMGALSAFTGGSSRNVANYWNPEFDALLAKAQSAADLRGAAAACAEGEGLLLSDGAAVPLLTQQGYCAMSKDLQGLDYRADRILFSGAYRGGQAPTSTPSPPAG